MVALFPRGLVVAFGIFAPLLASAQPQPGFGNVGSTVVVFIDFVNNILVPFLIALAFLMFIWGLFRFFFVSGANEAAREQGRQLMVWGVAAFVFMVSVWGLVNLIAEGLGFNYGTPPRLPIIPGS